MTIRVHKIFVILWNKAPKFYTNSIHIKGMARKPKHAVDFIFRLNIAQYIESFQYDTHWKSNRL